MLLHQKVVPPGPDTEAISSLLYVYGSLPQLKGLT